MRIAVLSDIHGNLPALRAVLADIDRWRPDLVILNGDLVNRGPSSLECLEIIQARVQRQAWRVVTGNHEEFVLHCADNAPTGSAIDGQFRQFTDWTLSQLGDAANWLRSWPAAIRFDTDGGSAVEVRHGSVLGSRDGIHQEMSDQELNDRLPMQRELFLTAHTHRAFSRWHDGVLVVNSGSVGTPFDGDRRACYLRIEQREGNWQVDPVRVEYDFELARRNFFDSRFIAEAGPFAKLFLAELESAHHLTRAWSLECESKVKAGSQTLDDSVRRFLQGRKFSLQAP